MTSPTTLPSIVDRFARFLEESDLSPITVKNYRADLRAFEKWFYETGEPDFDPAKITPTDLRQFRHFLLEKRRLRPNTINRHLATLRSFLNWAASTGLMPDGRMPTMPRGVREVRPGPRWLDRRERMALLKAVERERNPRDIAIVKLLLHTGLRVGELCSLTWRDVRITPRKGLMIIRNGKGQKRREIPLNQDVRNALLGIGYQEHAGSSRPIFLGQRGGLTPRGVQSLLGKYGKAAGLEEVSPHTLRHTFCKDLIDAGAKLQEVAALAGHESLDTTRRYCEPSIKDLERTVSLIEEEP